MRLIPAVVAGYVLGPVTGDHWFVYIADKCDRPDYTATDRTVRSKEVANMLQAYYGYGWHERNPTIVNTEWLTIVLPVFCSRQINMMMFDMHPDTAKHFYKEACPTGREMTKKTGIAELVPGAVVDDFAFDPCG